MAWDQNFESSNEKITIGKLHGMVRDMLKEELREIDGLVEKILV